MPSAGLRRDPLEGWTEPAIFRSIHPIKSVPSDELLSWRDCDGRIGTGSAWLLGDGRWGIVAASAA
jgi:hypothetical protein